MANNLSDGVYILDERDLLDIIKDGINNIKYVRSDFGNLDVITNTTEDVLQSNRGRPGYSDIYKITKMGGEVSYFCVYHAENEAIDNGKGIKDIILIGSYNKSSGATNTYRINYTDGSYYDFNINNGDKGADGTSVKSVKFIGNNANETVAAKPGKTDTYQLYPKTAEDGYGDPIGTFKVYNGNDGNASTVQGERGSMWFKPNDDPPGGKFKINDMFLITESYPGYIKGEIYQYLGPNGVNVNSAGWYDTKLNIIGQKGKGITNIIPASDNLSEESGGERRYQINYTEGDPDYFSVFNGQSGKSGSTLERLYDDSDLSDADNEILLESGVTTGIIFFSIGVPMTSDTAKGTICGTIVLPGGSITITKTQVYDVDTNMNITVSAEYQSNTQRYKLSIKGAEHYFRQIYWLKY